ncbi:Tfp pilus assembly protein PilO [Candidatus Scalindua japonica]|uniref:Tfp pilus assembly protein PilO n=1 Tax=Candidatus Scalindua japonica TaxID=1284222 RepID=A0A286TTL3_9BACT|nr:type 4a pilus biogenesis protein PilO [Candidatus Scalindua japonica]GAX59230.1 Tfp pilus assembly protein PilO [Candidatus Scalindua japonica]
MITLRMRKLDRFCLLTVVVVLVTCGYLIVSYVSKQKRQIQQETELLSEKLKKLNIAEVNLENLNKFLDDTKNELKIINDQIPETAKIGMFLTEIDSLMEQREQLLINIEPLPPIIEDNYKRIPIRVEFKGSFENTYKILHDLETMNRLLVMERINIFKSDTDKRCKVDLTTSVFEM